MEKTFELSLKGWAEICQIRKGKTWVKNLAGGTKEKAGGTGKIRLNLYFTLLTDF